MVKIGGNFVNVKTQGDADFFCDLFGDMATQLFGEKANKMVGAKTTLDLNEIEPKQWLWCSHSDEHAFFNLFTIFVEEVLQNIDAPCFGGKGTMQFDLNATGDGYDTEVISEALGKMHYSEIYTDEGMHLTFTKDGKSNTEFWRRVVKETGFYRYSKDEKFAEFMENVGMPSTLIAIRNDVSFDFKMSDKGFKFEESFGDKFKTTHEGKFDEEYSPVFSMEGIPVPKIVAVKSGPGKYKFVAKGFGPNGDTCEFNFNFTEEGLCMCANNLDSGVCGKLYLERCVNTAGTWKPLSIIGVKEAMTKLGCSADVSSKLANEYDARLEICQKGPATRWNWVSQHTPMDMIFKLNEEFECYDPAIKENVKIVITQCGKEFHWVSKYPKFTSKSKAIFGSDFMVMSSDIIGMDCPMTYIFERC